MSGQILQQVREMENCEITSVVEFNDSEDGPLVREAIIESVTPDKHREVLKSFTEDTNWDVDKFTPADPRISQNDTSSGTLHLVEFSTQIDL